MTAEKLTLLFDGTCGFCTRCAAWVKRLDRSDRVEIVPFQNPDRRESLGLTLAQCEAAAWTVRPDGARHRGHAAILDSVGWALGWPGLVRLAYFPGAEPLMRLVYAWVARNRHRLPGRTPHCQKHPEDC